MVGYTQLFHDILLSWLFHETGFLVLFIHCPLFLLAMNKILLYSGLHPSEVVRGKLFQAGGWYLKLNGRLQAGLATVFSHIPFHQFLQVFARKGINPQYSTSLVHTISLPLFCCKDCHYSSISLISLAAQGIMRASLQFGLRLWLLERLLSPDSG